jgi:hypothetical protein
VTTTTAEGQLHAAPGSGKDPASRIPKYTKLTTIWTSPGQRPDGRTLQLLFGAVGLLLLIACAMSQTCNWPSHGARVRYPVGAGRKARAVSAAVADERAAFFTRRRVGVAVRLWITHLTATLVPVRLVPNEARIEVNRHVLFFCLGISTRPGFFWVNARCNRRVRIWSSL